MLAADDFSFPVVQTPHSHHHFSVDPTSFWCVSPQSFSGYSHGAGADDDDDGGGGGGGDGDGDGDGDGVRGRRSDSGGCCSPSEKMDMLWEDFNDELNRVCISNNDQEAVLASPSPSEMSSRQRTGGGGGGGVVSVSHRRRKRQSVVEVLKVLKKMFLLHNSAASFSFISRTKPDRCYLNR